MSVPKKIRIAVVACNNVEDMELIIPIDIWNRAKFIVDVLVYDCKTTFQLSYSNLKVTSCLHFSTTNLSQYDAIYMPGGPGHKNYLRATSIERDMIESKLHSGIQRFYDDPNRYLLALCAAPISMMCILSEESRRDLKFTCYNDKELIGEFSKNWVNKKLVVDKNVITGQNAGCSFDLALATVEKLAGLELAQSIASKLFIDYRGAESYVELN